MLFPSIIQSIKEAKTAQVYNKVITEDLKVSDSNEFLFFIKPELLLEQPRLKTETILKMILNKVASYDLKIKNTRVLSAAYLKKHRIIAQHYGVINQIASNPKSVIAESAKKNFESIFDESFDKANIVGGLEMMEKFPAFTATGLDYLWQNAGFEKLAGGTYVGKIKLDGETFYLINGFHARQLEHFTIPGRCIVVMHLAGSLNWCEARSSLIGATCPKNARDGSIRRTLLDQMDAYGLQAVTPSWNGVHLSAGPIEGLVELIRYQSDFESGSALTAKDFAFGQKLIDTFGKEKTNWLLTNPNLDTESGSVSVFDLTEEKDSSEAIELLKPLL